MKRFSLPILFTALILVGVVFAATPRQRAPESRNAPPLVTRDAEASEAFTKLLTNNKPATLSAALNAAAALDTCDTCAAASYIVYNECLNQGHSECACSYVMNDYCFHNCSPCKFCADSVKAFNTYCLDSELARNK